MVRNRIIGIVLILLVFGACGPKETDRAKEAVSVQMKSESISDRSPFLLNISEAEEASTNDTFIFIDLRKKEDFKLGHIPGARSIWRPDIQNLELPYGGMRATKESLAELMGKLGISTEKKIVIYDEKGNVDAARLWWMLQLYGHEDSYLFNGGLSAWKNASLPLDTADSNHATTLFEFTGEGKQDWLANKEEVLDFSQSNSGVLLDTRSEKEFTGEEMKSGAFRSGHIPGAKWIDYIYAIRYNSDQEFLTLEELTEVYTSMGASKDTPIIVYCQSGVRSAHTTFVLRELLGFENVKNYDGSWIEWSYFNELPIAVVSKDETP